MFVPVRAIRGVSEVRGVRIGVGGGFTGDQGPVSNCPGDDESVGFGGVILRMSDFLDDEAFEGESRSTRVAVLIDTDRSTREVTFGGEACSGASNSSEFLVHSLTERGSGRRGRPSTSAAVSQ
jgi:hypothetical protein